MRASARDVLDRELATVVTIARTAGQILLAGWERRPAIEYKSVERDIVTEFDRRAEGAILEGLARAFPDAGIVGEEGGVVSDQGAGTFYVDPLDGTVNFAHGLPFFAVSIGLLRAGLPALGVVHAPALNWTFVGAPGWGAVRDGQSIAPSPLAQLDRALLVTNSPSPLQGRLHNVPAFVAFNGVAEGVRHLGSAALDLCFVACGWLDGTWQRGLQPWDTVGGAAIVTAAGGTVTELDGSAFQALSGDVLASNGRITKRWSISFCSCHRQLPGRRRQSADPTPSTRLQALGSMVTALPQLEHQHLSRSRSTTPVLSSVRDLGAFPVDLVQGRPGAMAGPRPVGTRISAAI